MDLDLSDELCRHIQDHWDAFLDFDDCTQGPNASNIEMPRSGPPSFAAERVRASPEQRRNDYICDVLRGQRSVPDSVQSLGFPAAEQLERLLLVRETPMQAMGQSLATHRVSFACLETGQRPRGTKHTGLPAPKFGGRASGPKSLPCSTPGALMMAYATDIRISGRLFRCNRYQLKESAESYPRLNIFTVEFQEETAVRRRRAAKSRASKSRNQSAAAQGSATELTSARAADGAALGAASQGGQVAPSLPLPLQPPLPAPPSQQEQLQQIATGCEQVRAVTSNESELDHALEQLALDARQLDDVREALLAAAARREAPEHVREVRKQLPLGDDYEKCHDIYDRKLLHVIVSDHPDW